MPVTTATTGIAPEFKQYWHRKLLLRATPALVYNQLFYHVNLPVGYGKTVEFRRFERLPPTTSPLTDEINPPAELTPSVTSLTATVQEYGALIKFSRMVEATAYDDFVSHLVEVLGEHMGESLDLIARNIVQPSTGTSFGSFITPGGKATTALTASDIINFDTIVRAVTTLRSNNVRPLVGNAPHGRYLGIIHPQVWAQLIRDPMVQNILHYTLPRSEDHPWYTGEVVHLMGVDFLVSSNAPAMTAGALGVGNPAVDCWRTIIVGREALADVQIDQVSSDIIIRPTGYPDSGDPMGRVGWVAWYANYTAVVLNANFGVEILSAR